jgi:hypothetical protein
MKTLILVLVLFLACACGQAPANFEGGHPGNYEMAAEQELSAAPVFRKAAADLKQPVAIDGRKLIRTGHLTLEVNDIQTIRNQMEKICGEFDAYISSDTQSHYQHRLECTQVVRIPSVHFDEFVNKVEALGVAIKDRTFETSDVTEEFIDTEARIKTKKELEQRYREILKQATQVSDMLSIEAQLNHVRSDIEAMEGRIKYLKNQVAYSTLTVSYYEPNGTESAFASKIVAALGNGWDMLLAFLVGVLSIWPFILVATGCVYLAVRKTRSRRKLSSNVTD